MRRQPYTDEARVNTRLSLDSLAFFLIVASLLFSFFVFTQAITQDVVLAVKSGFMAIFVMTGLILRPSFMGGFAYRQLGITDSVKSLLLGTLAFGVIVVLVFAQIPAMAEVDLPSRLFYTNMALVEEVFFNYFLFAWFCTLAPWPIASLMTGMAFAPFHIGVYGYDPNVLLFMFGARLVLCAIYWISGSLSSSMTAHLLFNLVATSSGSVILP